MNTEPLRQAAEAVEKELYVGWYVLPLADGFDGFTLVDSSNMTLADIPANCGVPPELLARYLQQLRPDAILALISELSEARAALAKAREEGRREGLEEAARECEKLFTEVKPDKENCRPVDWCNTTVRVATKNIRALASPPEPTEPAAETGQG